MGDMSEDVDTTEDSAGSEEEITSASNDKNGVHSNTDEDTESTGSDEEVISATYHKNDEVFNFEVPKSWWEEHHQDLKNLKPGWGNLLKSQFKAKIVDLKLKIHCSLSIATNKVVDKSSKKASSSYPFTGQMHCGAKGCSMTWFFRVLSFKDLHRNRIPVSVYGDGKHVHSKNNMVRANIRGKKRDQIKDRMEKGHMSASVMKRQLLMDKIRTHNADLLAGNLDDVPTTEALRQMKERRSEGDLHSNPWLNLKLRSVVVNIEQGPQSVFTVCDYPYQVSWAIDLMLEHMYELAKIVKVLIGYFDSTGGLIEPAKWDELKKAVQLYSLVVKEGNGAPIPVAEMFSNDQHEHEIRLFFARLLIRYQHFVETRYGSKPTSLPFKIMVCDMSWANSNAILDEIVGMSLITYLHACIEANQTGKLHFVILAWCYAHFLHAIVRKSKEWVPMVGAKKYSPARRLAKFTMAAMSRTDKLEDALSIFKLIVIVFKSPKYTMQVHSALSSLAEMFDMSTDELRDEDSAEAYLKDKNENPNLPVSIPEHDRACTRHHETYKDSPFYKSFKDVEDSVTLDKPEDSDEGNPFYILEFIFYLLRFMLPFYPFWSRYVQSILLPKALNALTNFAVELKFKLDKHQTFTRKKYHQGARFLEKMVEDTVQRIAEFKYPVNFKKYSKQKKVSNENEVVLEEEAIDDPAEPNVKKRPHPEVGSTSPKRRKVQQEIWKKKSSIRIPQGTYSSSQAQKYAPILKAKADALAASRKKRKLQLSKKGLSSKAAAEKEPSANSSSPEVLNSTEKEAPYMGNSDVGENQNSHENNQGIKPGTSSSAGCQHCILHGPPDGEYVCDTCGLPVHQFEGGCSVPSPDFLSDGPYMYSRRCLSCIGGHLRNDTHDSTPQHNENTCKDGTSESIPCTSQQGFVSPILGNKRINRNIKTTGRSCLLPWNVAVSKLEQPIQVPRRCAMVALDKYDFDSVLDSSKVVTDAIIDAFMKLVLQNEICNQWAQVFYLPSHILENMQLGLPGVLENVTESPIIFNDVWVIPCHVSRYHWVVFFVLIREKKILIMDSLYSKDQILKDCETRLQMIMLLIETSYANCLGKAVDWGDWEVFAAVDFPPQSNATDCGVYAILFIFSLLCGMKVMESTFQPRNMEKVRMWIARKLHDSSTPFAWPLVNSNSNNSNNRNDIGSEEEHADAQYREIDRQVQSGEKVIQEPWKKLAHVMPAVTFGSPGKPSLDFLADYLKNFFKSSDTKCGAPGACRCKGTNQMYLCDICREYLHLMCVGDQRPPPSDDSPYFCPIHTTGTTRSRINVKRPIRQRLSIS